MERVFIDILYGYGGLHCDLWCGVVVVVVALIVSCIVSCNFKNEKWKKIASRIFREFL